MPRQTQHYDPIIEDGSAQATAIRGFQVGIGGTYVLMDDVVTAIREYAQSLADPEFGSLVHDLANWLTSGQPLPQAPDYPNPGQVALTEFDVPADTIVHGAEADDVTLDVERVEMFPDADGKWYARSIDTSGNIMKITDGSFDKPWVLRNAEQRWPGIHLVEVQSAMDDSMWRERGHIGPSPKRLWAGVNA